MQTLDRIKKINEILNDNKNDNLEYDVVSGDKESITHIGPPTKCKCSSGTFSRTKSMSSSFLHIDNDKEQENVVEENDNDGDYNDKRKLDQ